jgi:hypothetical protein
VPGDASACTSRPTRPFAVDVTRDGSEPLEVWRAEAARAASHPTPDDASANGCGWPVALEIPSATGHRATTP